MMTHAAGNRRGQWGLSLLAVLGLAGCGGEAGRHDAAGNSAETSQGKPSGAATGSGPSTQPGVTQGSDTPTVGGSTATSVGDSGGSAGPGVTYLGGSGGEYVGGASGGYIGGGSGGGYVGGGSGGVGSATSGPACSDAKLFASAEVTDVAGEAREGTNGKVRVTVTKVEEAAAYPTAAPADLKTRNYVLRGPVQDWGVSATIPGLTSELIKLGDELDFQLQTSPGFVPLVGATNQAFALFTPAGDLLLFAAATYGYTPVPDLAFLGMQATDAGINCREGSYGFGCLYEVHDLHLSASGTELDLQRGHSGQLGKLLVGLQEYLNVTSNAGGCDGSGQSLIVGVKSVAK